MLTDLTGIRFGRLVVKKRGEKYLHNKIHWLCECDCGNVKEIASPSLKNGMTKSCGCLRREVTKNKRLIHGMSESREYSAWLAIKARCNRKSSDHWKYYGGRGIKVCKRWMDSFEHFFADMGECPEGFSIERINVNGNYEPSNCTWIPLNEQQKNTRRSLK